MNNAGRVLSRRLRLHLAVCECRDLIRTVRGAGYMFDLGAWSAPDEPA